MADRPMPKPRKPDPALPNEAGKLPLSPAKGAVEVRVEHLQVLRLEPDDVLVITTKLPLSAAAADYMREELECTFPGHKAIVLDSDSAIGVMRHTDEGIDIPEVKKGGVRGG